jgi:hypothetical protein
MGCSIGQGFLFAQALPRDATQAFVELAHREGLAAAREAQLESSHGLPQSWPSTRLQLRSVLQLPDTRFTGGEL